MFSDVGVVVIGRNEGERLVACVASLAPFGLPIVYVDSGSTDGSREAARAAGAEVVNLDLARPFTAARARNEGAAALLARAPALRYVQFVDGDCEVVPGWLAGAHDTLASHPDVVVVCGRRAERYPDRSLYNRLCDQEWNTPVGEALACGGDAMMRLDAYQAAGGFDPAMVAHEEPEFCARLRARGGIIQRIDRPMTLHDANILSIRPWWRRSVRAGFGYSQALARAPGLRSAEAALLRRAWTWALLLPVALGLALAVTPFAAALLLLYPLQIVRLAVRQHRAGGAAPLASALLSVAGKFAEALGSSQYLLDRLRGRQRGAILYR